MTKEKIKGLGGWLTLWTIGIIASVLIISASLIGNIYIKYSSGVLFSGFLLSLLSIYAILYFYKKKIFVSTTQVILTVSTTLSIILYAVSFNTNYIFSVMGSGLWLLYFYKSERVKNTFTY